MTAVTVSGTSYDISNNDGVRDAFIAKVAKHNGIDSPDTSTAIFGETPAVKNAISVALGASHTALDPSTVAEQTITVGVYPHADGTLEKALLDCDTTSLPATFSFNGHTYQVTAYDAPNLNMAGQGGTYHYKDLGPATAAPTYNVQGQTLWEINRTNLQDNINANTDFADALEAFSYETDLDDAQKATYDLYANINGTGSQAFVAAYNASEGTTHAEKVADAIAALDAKIDASKTFGNLNDDVQITNATTAGVEPARGGPRAESTTRPAGLDAAQTALFDTAKDVNPLLQSYATLKQELATLTQEIANPATTSERLGKVKDRLEALTSEISENATALAAQKTAVEGLVAGTAISATGNELSANTLKADFAAATPLEADRAKQAGLVDGAIARAEIREAPALSFSFTDMKAAEKALKREKADHGGDEKWSAYDLPESYIRGIYDSGSQIATNEHKGRLDPRRSDMGKYVDKNEDKIAESYLTYVKDLVLKGLHDAGYSQAQIDANHDMVDRAITTAAAKAKPVDANGAAKIVDQGGDATGLTLDVSAGIKQFKDESKTAGVTPALPGATA
jgi:hypothetical protein